MTIETMRASLFRFGFVLACSAYVLGLVLLADWQGVAVAFLVGVIGILAAVALAQDFSAEPAPDGNRVLTRRHRRMGRDPRLEDV